jgi:hypothetical protein
VYQQLCYNNKTNRRRQVLVDNTRENREIKNVAATMAIEDMYFSKEFISEMIKVSKGEKTSEELRREIIKKYVR